MGVSRAGGAVWGSQIGPISPTTTTTSNNNNNWPVVVVVVGAASTFLNTLQSHPAVILFVYLYAKSTIPDARARNPNRFCFAHAVVALLPASGNRSNYSHDFLA
jgi:hypothetical protein